MPDELIYETHCPGCGCQIVISSTSEEPIDISFAMRLSNPTVQKAASQGRRQDADGDQAMGD